MPQLVPRRLLDSLAPQTAGRFELPADALRESRRRVAIAAAIGCAAYTVFLATEGPRATGATALERAIARAHDLTGLAVCAAVWAATALRAIDDRRVLALALGAEVLLAAAMSVAMPWGQFLRTGHLSSLTWVIPMIILFPSIVPAAPSRAIPVSILCALTMPLGLFALAAQGAVAVRVADYWSVLVSGGVAVGIAAVASRTIHGAARQVAAARRAGSYELLDLLGRGGMGEVWKARHQFLSRPAAVKRILPGMLQGAAEGRDAALARFEREAQATASLRSPHTVELFDFGASADGSLYYAMELLDGLNLAHFVHRFGPVEPRRAVDWLRQVLHSLAEAHARGLVHRDLKPGNVFLCRQGLDVDFVKVLDFGLAKPFDDHADLDLTAPGARMGSPGFMSPEQALAGATDPRTDLYAAGVLAYWLLAGRKPFEGASAGELMRQHVHAAPPPLAAASPFPIAPALAAAIHACLAKDPAARPGDAGELSAALEAALDAPRWTQVEARRWWREHLTAG